jgi:hypothetical protein
MLVYNLHSDEERNGVDNVASTVQRRKASEIRVNKTIQKKEYKTKREGYKTIVKEM